MAFLFVLALIAVLYFIYRANAWKKCAKNFQSLYEDERKLTEFLEGRIGGFNTQAHFYRGLLATSAKLLLASSQKRDEAIKLLGGTPIGPVFGATPDKPVEGVSECTGCRAECCPSHDTDDDDDWDDDDDDGVSPMTESSIEKCFAEGPGCDCGNSCKFREPQGVA